MTFIVLTTAYGATEIMIRSEQVTAFRSDPEGGVLWLEGQDDAFFVLESAKEICEALRVASDPPSIVEARRMFIVRNGLEWIRRITPIGKEDNV